MQDKIYHLQECRQLTPNVAQIFLSRGDSSPLVYEAGQYIKVVHPDQGTSPLSIANAPANDFASIEFHLLHTKENYGATSILRQLNEKKQLILRGPFGSCTAENLTLTKPIIFIARGTGFAPIKAVVEKLVQRPAYPAMHLYWSVAGWRDIYMHDLVEGWVRTLKDFNFTAVLSREMPVDGSVKFGKIPDVILQDYPDLSAFQVYASGPESMIYAALKGFEDRGLTKDHFHSDLFDYVP